ncbi:alpha/beta hydrolase [Longispora sp. K20-0274]|uniref:alpha/beta fold hydrolase n=1 Tax=Longispora sp. K20-0274 TaxID=3088255 RepID=UPI00399A8CF1
MTVEGPGGVLLESLTTGSGTPVTVFAHGLAGGIADTRPLGGAVAGSRVFFQFRGHGASTAPAGEWTYQDLAEDLRAVADASGATRAVGVSLGAGALCRLLTAEPTRFDKIVLFLPAVLDEPRPAAARTRLDGLLRGIADRDREAVSAQVASEVPEELRGSAAGRAFIAQRTTNLLGSGLGASLAGLPGQTAVESAEPLKAVTAEALVIGCRGDALHPAETAERVAGFLPAATLHVYDEPHPLWRHRHDLRERISTFLNN